MNLPISGTQTLPDAFSAVNAAFTTVDSTLSTIENLDFSYDQVASINLGAINVTFSITSENSDGSLEGIFTSTSSPPVISWPVSSNSGYSASYITSLSSPEIRLLSAINYSTSTAIYRIGFLNFNTSTIPSNSTIISASIKLAISSLITQKIVNNTATYSVNDILSDQTFSINWYNNLSTLETSDYSDTLQADAYSVAINKTGTDTDRLNQIKNQYLSLTNLNNIQTGAGSYTGLRIFIGGSILSQPTNATYTGLQIYFYGYNETVPSDQTATTLYVTYELPTSFYYKSGKFTRNDGTEVSISAGSISLSGTNTNYIEINPTAGTVVSNTTAFTNGYIPLWKVTTLNGGITSVKDYRQSLVQPQPVPQTTTDNPGTVGQYFVQTVAVTGKIDAALIPTAPSVDGQSATSATNPLPGYLIATDSTTGLLPTSIMPDAPTVGGFSAVASTSGSFNQVILATSSAGKLPVAVIPQANAASLSGYTIGTGSNQIPILEAGDKYPLSIFSTVDALFVDGQQAVNAATAGANKLVALNSSGYFPDSVVPKKEEIDLTFYLGYLGS